MNAGLLISPAVDSAALNQLFAKSWPDHQTTDFAQLLDHALFYVCAYEQEQLIGFVKVISDGGIHGFLLDPTVDPAHRRQGHGTALVRTALVEAKRRGLAWLHVDYEPHLAQFYARCGFRTSRAGVMKLSE